MTHQNRTADAPDRASNAVRDIVLLARAEHDGTSADLPLAGSDPAHALEAARRSLPVLHALPPGSLPGPARLREALGERRIAALAAQFSDGRAGARGLPTQAARPAQVLAGLVACGQAPEAALHDAYFVIERTAADQPAAQLEAIVLAAAALKAERRRAMPERERAAADQVALGLAHAFALASGMTPAPIGSVRGRARRLDPVLAAARRWLRGHQIFLVLSQGMLQAAELLRAPGAAEAGTEALIVLMRASAAALRLTGAFDPAIYEAVIRPSMAPPNMPDGFSGLFSSDHRLLVRTLRDLGPVWREIDRAEPELHRSLVASFAALYDDHITVCGRFVGADRGSLLLGAQATCNALEQLGNFKRSRLRLLRA